MGIPRGRRAMHWALLGVTLAGAVGVRAATDGRFEMYAPRNAVQWVRSPEAMRRLSLGFDSLLADVYWIRAVQYYGGTRLSDEGDNRHLLSEACAPKPNGVDAQVDCVQLFQMKIPSSTAVSKMNL
jgi:hypothetical protein